MNASPNLDREHILDVCDTVVTRPSVPQASSEEITLAFPDERRRDQANDALRRSGYATQAALLDDDPPYGIQVTGWSSERLERRAALLHSVAERYGADVPLQQTATRAIDAAAAQPVNAEPVPASYAVATETTERVISEITLDAGPITALTRLAADPELSERLRNIQRLTDRVNSVVGDHFNVACIAAATYIRTRREQPEGKPADLADEAARDHAWAEARAFIADPIDTDAFIEAAAWAHHQHFNPDRAGAFALDYAREHRGTDPDQRPRPEQAYTAWRDAQAADSPPESASQVAAADFPHPPGAAGAAEPEQVQNAAGPSRTRAPRRPQ